MNLGSSLKTFTKGLAVGAKKNAPTLMLIGAGGTMIATMVLTWKARPKCDDILARREEEIEALTAPVVCDVLDPQTDEVVGQKEETPDISEEEIKERTRKINLKTGIEVAKVLALPLITGLTTIGLAAAAQKINLRRLADMSALYEISSDALMRYRKKTEDVVGEKKARSIDEAIDKDVAEAVHSNGVEPVNTGGGTTYCIDSWTGQKFLSSKNEIDKAINELNYILSQSVQFDDFLSLNDYLRAIGHGKLMEVDNGEDIGWNASNGLIEIRTTSVLIDDIPYMVISFRENSRPRPAIKWGDM